MSTTTMSLEGIQMGNALAVRFAGHRSDANVRVNLSAVIDVSGSMGSNNKLTTVKATLREMVKFLHPDDTLSIITFESTASVLLDTTKASETLSIQAAIDSLTAHGGTNMEEAFKKLSALSVAPDAVFLLTDGMIMSGAKDHSTLFTYMNSLHHVPVFTVGYGADHNQGLLQQFAMASSGTYGVANVESDVPDIVGNILGGLKTIVARYGVLSVPAGWQIAEFNAVDTASTFTVGHIISDVERWVLLTRNNDCVEPVHLEFKWASSDGTETTISATSVMADTNEKQYDVTEQQIRCTSVVYLMNAFDLIQTNTTNGFTDAQKCLRKLVSLLDVCNCKERPAVAATIQQVNTLLEFVTRFVETGETYDSFGHGMHLYRQVSAALATTASSLANQRGHMSSVVDDPDAYHSAVAIDTSAAAYMPSQNPYASATQRMVSESLTTSVRSASHT